MIFCVRKALFGTKLKLEAMLCNSFKTRREKSMSMAWWSLLHADALACVKSITVHRSLQFWSLGSVAAVALLLLWQQRSRPEVCSALRFTTRPATVSAARMQYILASAGSSPLCRSLLQVRGQSNSYIPQIAE